jgi:hypothetical protein
MVKNCVTSASTKLNFSIQIQFLALLCKLCLKPAHIAIMPQRLLRAAPAQRSPYEIFIYIHK